MGSQRSKRFRAISRNAFDIANDQFAGTNLEHAALCRRGYPIFNGAKRFERSEGILLGLAA